MEEITHCTSFDQPCDEPIFRSGMCYKHIVKALQFMGEPIPDPPVL